MFNKSMPIFCKGNVKITDDKSKETAGCALIIVSNNNPYVSVIKKILVTNCENAL